MKRLHILTIFAVLTLLLCCLLPTKANAATEGYYTYTVSMYGKATIEDCDTSIAGDVTIPATLGGYPVTGIEYCAFYFCTEITNITIPDGVTSIGSLAFACCRSLTNVTLPDSVTSISYSAFSGCSSLASIAIPDGVTSIYGSTFCDCSNLTNVIIPTSVTTIDDSAFSGCSSLTNINIPNSVTSIGEEAFRGCSSLVNIKIPDRVTSIGEEAFYGCSSLKTVTVFAGEILSEAFWNCSNLERVTLEDGVTGIGKEAFYNCTNLTDVTIGEGTLYIGDYAFKNCENLREIAIPDSVTSIGRSAFEYCESLTSVIIGDGVTHIAYGAFFYCEYLENVSLGNGVTNIAGNAFYGCSSLTEITLPKNVTSIGNQAFGGCNNLMGIYVHEENLYYSTGEYGVLFNKSQTELIQAPGGMTGNYIVPDSVMLIGDSAFSGCDLTGIVISNNVTCIEDDAFRGCVYLQSAVIGNAVSDMGSYVFANCESLSSVKIQDGEKAVISIGDLAFWWCSSLTSIDIPDSVGSIGNRAFSACEKLTTVKIGKGVTSIGSDALSTSDWGVDSNLVEIWVDPENTVYSSDDFGVLFNKEKTVLCRVPEAFPADSYTVPEGVTTIGESAVSYCNNLLSINIPASVTTIGECAFWETNITDVYYAGSPTMWDAIPIDWDTNYELVYRMTIHYGLSILGGDGTWYEALGQAAAAIDQGDMLKLYGNVKESLAITKTVSIDLNGFDILGTVTVEDGCVLYCFDSQTDDYTVNDDDGYGKIAHVSGNVQGIPEKSIFAEDGYLMITEDDGVSFHRVNLQLTAMTLRASRVGVYYKCEFAGDEIVAQNVSRFGVVLSVDGVPTEEKTGVMSWFEGFQAGSNGSETTSTLLHGIMKSGRTAEKNAAYATMPIYGRAYILTNDGQYLFGAAVSRSLQEQVESADAMWAELSTQQQTELTAMYQNYRGVMQNWNVPNLRTAASSEAVLLPSKEVLIA